MTIKSEIVDIYFYSSHVSFLSVTLFNGTNHPFLSLNMQPKPKKDGPMSLEEAVDDSENLTDFLMDFEEEE